jgi:hypothetical protein
MPRDLHGPAPERRTLDDIHPGPVVALHVEVRREEVRGAALLEIARDRERLEEDLRHDHGAAPVEHGAAVVNRGEGSREAKEIPVAGGTEGCPVGGGVLMDDFRPDRGVDGHRDPGPMAGEEHRHFIPRA